MKKEINKISTILGRTAFMLFLVAIIGTTPACSGNKGGGEIPTPDLPGEGSDVDTVPESEFLWNTNLAAVARGGEVIASSEESSGIQGPDKLIDGDFDRNNHYGSSQTNSDHDEWMQFKLCQVQKINEVWLYPRIAGEGFPYEFQIQVSADNAQTWKTVKTVTRTEQPTTILPISVSFDQVAATHVRVFCSKLAYIANEWTSWQKVFYIQLVEVEVYLTDGNMNEEEANIAYNGTATSSSQQDATHGPGSLIDGKTTYSHTDYFGTLPKSEDGLEWIQIELRKESEVSEIWLYPRYYFDDENPGETAGFPIDFEIKVSANGTDWTTIASKSNYTTPPYSIQDPEIFEVASPVKTKYVRIEATKLATVGIWDEDSLDYIQKYVLQLAEVEAYE